MAREKKIYPLADGLSTQDTFAVLGDIEKFKTHKHAWKVWQALKEFRCTVYPVAEGLGRLDGSKVYSTLTELTDKVTVIIPCLLPEKLTSLVSDAVAAGCGKIWFQEQTWSKELQEECDRAGLEVIRGCVLRHRIYPSKISLRYFSPCYWHGLRDAKVPLKRYGK
ncbi:CoA-binding protein [Desulfosporosinus sp. HMP52]|uniref:CoA-binding protein n=1 Tax=Desulfosporosinus sp. HMP52 TaxID=1487923 RepID=UPI00051FF271|nr:CoA-binding protein [Desulfosporosinus sp. HMP52]KGK91702.1 CoA-binding protein [Desulfosporosinus sp. HMP52]